MGNIWRGEPGAPFKPVVGLSEMEGAQDQLKPGRQTPQAS